MTDQCTVDSRTAKDQDRKEKSAIFFEMAQTLSATHDVFTLENQTLECVGAILTRNPSSPFDFVN